MELIALRCRISELATARGWSMRELARRTGLSKSSLADYDNMKNDIPLRKAIILAKTLECRPEELHEYNDKEFAAFR